MKALILLCLWPLNSFAGEIPPVRVRVGLQQASKIPRWLIELTSPADHHFNLSAPMKVEARAVPFKTVLKKDRLIGFAATSLDLTEKDKGTISVFLCDDAKTYCVRKSQEILLKLDPTLQGFHEGRILPGRGTPKRNQKKDQNGFILQDQEAAFSESLRTGKPLLIDFFGVWCPPCNLYDELVFSSPGFKSISKKFVLLKMDADRESSFALKSKMSVGGYPTLLVVQALPTIGSEKPEVTLSELGRVVGFLPTKELGSRLSEILEFKSETLDDRINRQKKELAGTFRLKIGRALEAREGGEASRLAKTASTLFPDSVELKLLDLKGRLMDLDKPVWSEEDIRLILEAVSVPEKNESRILLLALGMVQESGKSFRVEQKSILFAAVAELRRRVDPVRLLISGTELSIADLDVLEMELAQAFLDESRAATARKMAIQNYRKLMRIQNNPESRGMNLELAALLLQDNQPAEALGIYQKFIQMYPKEFTFHHGAARVYLEMNDLKNARLHAEEAVRHAYGDNLIRSMDRLIKVMQKQGESVFALKRGEEFLKGVSLDPNLRVRTGRYVSALTATLEEIRKDIPRP
ncbi:MAG: thioredoxin family protein [Bdellovibrionales bacterium]|nr:thioredoxin family protein [Bdellovibrionales bacterium]